MTIGDRIKQKREEKGLSQRDLAKIMGYAGSSTIAKIELNQVDINQKRVNQFAEVLGTTVPYLMGIESPQQKNDTIADVVIRLRSDADFYAVVDRLARDAPTLALVEAIFSLDDVKLNSIIVMVDALTK